MTERPFDRAFDFLHVDDRPEKLRERGIAVIRGPYGPIGPRELRDLLEPMGWYVDIFKDSGGSFALTDRETVRELNDICHEHDVRVSTGGFVENVLVRDNDRVEAYPRRPRSWVSTSSRFRRGSSPSTPRTWSR